MGKFSRLGNQLYTGQKSIDFVGRRWLWYAISGVVMVVAVVSLLVRGMNFGIEFTGGAEYRVPVTNATQTVADDMRDAVAGTGLTPAASPVVTTVKTTSGDSIVVQVEPLTDSESATIAKVIAQTAHVSQGELSEDQIGASFGRDVAQRSLIGLGVFLVLVMLFIWAYFRQWKMSVAAIVALAHDLLITIGVYALSGFEVTPATVTGLLTILGFSLYDTVVVFDKIRENTKNLRSSRQTYVGAANLAVNQTLVRSINTSLVALLPVAAILYVGIVQLGSGTLKDLALALFVGLASGAYSSIFIATPLLAQLKANEPEVIDAEKRAKARLKQADRYSAVPTFKEDMPIGEEVGARTGTLQEDRDPENRDDLDGDVDPLPTRTPRAPQAAGRGRVAPPARGPVRPSGAAGRQQPTREPRSKRSGK